MVVELEVAIQRRHELRPIGEIARIDELVLQAAPQAFDEDIVQRTPASIHADRYAALFQWRQKVRRGELATLIGVPDLGLAETERRRQRGQTEAGIYGIGEFPTEHETAEPIHDGDQIEKAAPHRNIGNI